MVSTSDYYVSMVANEAQYLTDPNGARKFLMRVGDLFADNVPDFYVERYGAVGDGVTDDRYAIQNAIDAAQKAGGGRVIFSNKTYLVGANPLTPTNNIACALRVGHKVQLIGAGMASTVIKLAASSNCAVISNYVSTDGIESNAEFIAIRNLKIDGNKANNSSGHGISFTTYPNSSQATNDLDFDTHQYFENIWIHECKQNGFVQTGRSSSVLLNVFAYKNDGQGIVPAYDTVLVGCVSGWAGSEGFYTEQSQVKFFCCTSFFSGQIVPANGTGFTVKFANQGNVMFLGCVAQDNYASGFNIDTSSRVSLNGCNSDSNGRNGVATYAGYDLWATTYSEIVACVALERKPYNSNSYQQNALRIRSNSTNNVIQLTHSAYNGAFIGTAIKSDSNSVDGNNISINAQGESSAQTVAYASSIVPDPYAGSTKHIALTGNITIGATVNHHSGSRMRFVFGQDATGGRTVTWNSQYKVNWTPTTTANKINTIDFEYNGTYWVQNGGIVNLN